MVDELQRSAVAEIVRFSSCQGAGGGRTFEILPNSATENCGSRAHLLTGCDQALSRCRAFPLSIYIIIPRLSNHNQGPNRTNKPN